jgi:N,N'-diacetylchitobiose transport system permease protein
MTALRTSPPAAAAMTVAGAEPPPRRRRRPLLPYGLLLPAAAILALTLGYPLVRLVLISLQDYGLRSLFTGTVGWAGTANYAAVLRSPDLAPVLMRSIGFCAALVIGTLVVGLGVALLMRQLGRRMRAAVMFALIAAWAIPNVASTLIWQWLFQPVYGVVNWLLTRVGVLGDLTQHDWTTSAFSAFTLVWLLVVWQSVPFVALTLHAGLTQIPRSYYEAAAIDGAGPVRVFATITLPFLRPILGLVTILSVIWDFTVFNQIWILTQGGPSGQTTTLGIWTFTTAFSKNSFGQGGAIAVVSVVLLIALTAVYVRRLVRSGEAI